MKKLKEINALIVRGTESARVVLADNNATFEDFERDILTALLQDYNINNAKAALSGDTDALHKLLVAQEAVAAFTHITSPQYSYWRPISVKADKSTAGKASAAAKAVWHSEGKAQAIAIRKVNPTLTQGDLADKIISHWFEKKIKPHCGREQLIKLIRGWENDKKKPLPKAKRC